jgi:hypothetical protein
VVQDLVPDDAHHLEALLAADRVDDHVAVDADKVLRVEMLYSSWPAVSIISTAKSWLR